MMRYWVPKSVPLLLLSFLAACGGGGGGGNGTPSVTPPSNLQYTSPPAYTVKQAIASLTPTVMGQVSSYSVSPTLPVGLSINAASGVISGTPSSVTAKQSYVVTATNSGGSTTATVSIVVNDVAPTVAYQSPYYAYTANVAATTITPTAGGGAAVSWSISPALPAGLSFDSTKGVISGTPTAGSAATAYTVTVSNSGGQATANLTIAVAGAPLFNLGHAASVASLRTNASDVLSLDVNGHWLLQNYASGAIVASGDTPCNSSTPCLGLDNLGRIGGLVPYYLVDVAGSTMIDAVAGGVEIRSTADGHVLGTASGQFSWFQLASDGSYLCTGSTTALTAWSSSGQVVVSHPGDYSKAPVFCAPGEVLAALGPAGQSVIEAVSLPAGTASVSPSFQGVFQNWFADGTGFMTAQGNVVWAYSSAAVQEGLVQLTQAPGIGSLGGVNNWFWTCGGQNIYKVGSSTSPAYTYGTGCSVGAALVSQQRLVGAGPPGVLPNGMSNGMFSVLDLSGTSVAEVFCSMSVILYPSQVQTSAWVPGSSCVLGSSWGVIFDSASPANQPRFLTDGIAFSVAGGAAHASIATGSGNVYTFDASTNSLVNTIAFPGHQLSMSSSGTVLAVRENAETSGQPPNTTVNIYSLPSGTLINTFPASLNIQSMVLSGSGTVLGQLLYVANGGCNAETAPVGGGAPLWCDTTGTTQILQISPDGSLVASAQDSITLLGTPSSTTRLFNNGTLVTAVPGRGIGWLDSGRLLATNYIQQKYRTQYTGATIYSPTGAILASPALPEIDVIQTVDTNSVYSPELNSIFSLTTGAALWTSANPGNPYGYRNPGDVNINSAPVSGVIAGAEVVFVSGPLVLAQPH